jgi:hypothetical protein
VCGLGGLASRKLEKPLSIKSKFTDRTKTGETATLVASGFLFGVSVISKGQHHTAPFGTGFLSFPGEGLPLEWWQPSISAMSPLCRWFAATLACDPVTAGSVQPMTHASTAILKESPTAVPALTVCDVERIPIRTIRLLERH